jgi:hypothetical protein
MLASCLRGLEYDTFFFFVVLYTTYRLNTLTVHICIDATITIYYLSIFYYICCDQKSMMLRDRDHDQKHPLNSNNKTNE